MTSYNAIIVLASGIKDDGTLPQSAVDRIARAKKIFDGQVNSKIIMSGRWSLYRKKHQPMMTEAKLMKQVAIEMGVPASVILTEEESHTTNENIQNTIHNILKPNGWKKVAIVTSDFHISRVKKIVSEYAIDGYLFDLYGTKTPKATVIKNIVRKIIEYRRCN